MAGKADIKHVTRCDYVSFIKLVSVILVLLYHSALPYMDNPYYLERADFCTRPVTFLCNLLDNTVIPSFFVASGFLYALSLQNHPERSKLARILERSKRFLLTYLIYGTLWMVPLDTLFDIKTFGRPEHATLLEGYKYFLLGQFGDNLWFLLPIFWVALFFILTKDLLKDKLIIVAFAATTAMALIIHYLLADFPYYKVSQVDPYLFCFFAGIVLLNLRSKIEAMSRWGSLGLAALFAIVPVMWAILTPSNFVITYIAKVTGAVMVFFLCLFFKKTPVFDHIKKNKIYRFFETRTLNIYLFCCPFNYITFRLLYPVVGKNAYLCIFLVFILSTLCTSIMVVGQNAVLYLWKKIRGKDNGRSEAST